MLVYSLRSKNSRTDLLTLKELEDQSTEEKLNFLKYTLNDLHCKIDQLQDQIEASQEANLSKTADTTLSFCREESLYLFQRKRPLSIDNELQVTEFLGSLVPSPCDSGRKLYHENFIDEIQQHIEATQQSIIKQQTLIENNEENIENNRAQSDLLEKRCVDLGVQIQNQKAQNQRLKLNLSFKQQALKQQNLCFENELKELQKKEKGVRTRYTKNQKILNQLLQEKVKLVANQDQITRQSEAKNQELKEKVKYLEAKNDQPQPLRLNSQNHLIKDLQNFAAIQNDQESMDNTPILRSARYSIQSNGKRTTVRLNFSQSNKVVIQKIEKTEEDINEPVITPAVIELPGSSIILDKSKKNNDFQSPSGTSEKRRDSCGNCQIF